MDRKIVYQTDPMGVYVGETFAQISPLEVDEGVYLIPAGAYEDAPPAARDGFAIVRQDDGWQYVEDNRGTVYDTQTGGAHDWTDMGSLPAHLTRTARPSAWHTWDGAEWIQDAAAQARAQRDGLLNDLDSIVSNPLRWAGFDDAQKSSLVAYRQALLDVPQQPGFPEDIDWPRLPAFID